jgi:exodeoxyribonuclease VII large subunit
MEDLWCFNEEPVVRALAASRIPTVSAVGHEIDVTLADLAADVRALTPTEAAERVVPSALDVTAAIDAMRARMQRALARRTDTARERLDALASRPVLARPLDTINQLSREADDLGNRLTTSTAACLRNWNQTLARVGGKLETLSPLGVLARGYSVTTDAESGNLVTQANKLRPGQSLHTRLAKGSVLSTVERIDT